MRLSKTEQARNLERGPYDRLFTFPKWNRFVTVRDEPSLFRRLPEFASWTKTQHLDEAYTLRYVADVQEAEAHKDIRSAEQTYGDHGPLISGGLRDHWPAGEKDRIRFHWQARNRAADASMAHWKAAGKRQDWQQHCVRPHVAE
jgi:hypothetical protein